MPCVSTRQCSSICSCGADILLYMLSAGYHSCRVSIARPRFTQTWLTGT